MASHLTPTDSTTVDFGPNVITFDAPMSMADITRGISAIFLEQNQDPSQFGTGRYAYLFKPGSYELSVDMGYYRTVHGLGKIPADVIITDAVQSTSATTEGLALNNFWRGVENLTIGQLFLWDYHFDNKAGNFSSGGFIADSVIDIQVISGTQQQFLTRNTDLTNWIGEVWNMVFVGDENAPTSSWPTDSYTAINETPVIREKPYLTIDDNGNYAVQVPSLTQDRKGASWTSSATSAITLHISSFHIAKPAADPASSMNEALEQGLRLILIPGIYHLSTALHVSHANTVVLGLGMATLVANNDTSTMIIDDVDGVSVSGLIFDVGTHQTAPILVLGPTNSSADHSSNPTALFDLSCRVGGATAGSADTCFVINSNNVRLDNIWLWRADHGKPDTVGCTKNPAQTGLVVNGDKVTAYGLFVEHFQGYQTLWNCNGGQVYFYQSEIPYDVPDQDSWLQLPSLGYASYKVTDQVVSHAANGLGVYCNFDNKVQLENATETPIVPGVKMSHMITQWLSGAPGSGINHISNRDGVSMSTSTSRSQN